MALLNVSRRAIGRSIPAALDNEGCPCLTTRQRLPVAQAPADVVVGMAFGFTKTMHWRGLTRQPTSPRRDGRRGSRPVPNAVAIGLYLLGSQRRTVWHPENR